MTLPLVALYSQALGATPALIGIVLGTGFVLPVLTAVYLGGWVERLGAPRMILLGALGLATAPLIPALCPSLLALAMLQIAAGLSHLAGVVAAQSYVARISGSRERNFGWYTTLVSLGQLIGPFALGAIIEVLGYRGALVASGGAGVVAAGLSRLLPRLSECPTGGAVPLPSTIDGPELSANRPLRAALLASGATLFALGVHQTFFPVYLDTQHISSTLIGILVGLRALASIAVRPFLAPLGKAVGQRSVMLGVTLLLCGLGLALIPLGNVVALFAAASVLLGLGSGISQPLTMVVLSDHVHQARRGTALGARLSVNFFALGLSTLLLGALIPVLGYATSFIACAILPATVGAWVWRGGTRLEAPHGVG